MSSHDHSIFQIGLDSDLEASVRAFRTLLLLAQRLRYLMDDRLREDGLTTQQAALLTAVSSLGRPSLNEAAVALGTTHQNTAQLVAALLRKDLIQIVDDPKDKRRRCLVTTASNEKYWRKRNASDHAAVKEWFSVLSEEELQTLCTLANRVAERLNESRQTPRTKRTIRRRKPSD